MDRRSKNLNKILRACWVFLLLLCGFIAGQQVPSTFLKHPLATLQLMRTLPVGSHVVLAEDIQLDGRSIESTWGNYGVVIGYETIKNLESKTILLCRIRTNQGSGPLLAINPLLIRRTS